MESKCEDKAGSKEEGQGVPQGHGAQNLVVRFCEYSVRVLNQEMDDFFEDNMHLFDQEDEELRSGAGETLEQYDVYQQYIAELEKRFDRFAVEEGFDSALDCFKALNDVVVEDKLEREQAMKDMARRMKEMQEEWQKKLVKQNEDSDSKAEGKCDYDKHHRSAHDDKGNSDEDTKADSKDSSHDDDVAREMQQQAPPVMMFFQPVSMDSLLKNVLNITEYTTFSTVMRTKVRQAKLLRIMEDNVSRQEGNQANRADILNGASSRDLTDVFDELVDRICGLTPHQKELHEAVRSQLKTDDWSDMIESATEDDFPSKYQHVFKRLVMTVCMSIWNMVSIAAQQKVRLELCRFLPQIDRLAGREDVFMAASGFLVMSHTFVDETERNMVEVLLAHSTHHRKRKAESDGNREEK